MSNAGSALREGVEQALGDMLTGDWWRDSGEQRLDAGLWAAVEELGLPGLLLDADAGGAGASLAEAHGALQALGALAVPVPAAESMLARWLAARAGLTLPDGPVTFGPLQSGAPAALVRGNREWLLTGRVHGVPWAADAAAVLLQAQSDGAEMWCVVHDSGTRVEPGSALSGEPRDTLTDHSVALSTEAVARAPDDHLLWQAGAAMRAVQMAAALARALEMSVGYARERVQFGRPLAKFQAIQQQLAQLAAQSTAASVAARRAFVALDAIDAGQREFAVAAAKVAVGQAASQGVAIAHQSHGAMGFTAEYGLHRLTRRIWSWREEFGNEAWWSRRLGARVCADGAEHLWDSLIAEPRRGPATA